ncbi:MAG: DUF3108 domain-containing protein [Candidatus Omnitrophota bacterium]
MKKILIILAVGILILVVAQAVFDSPRAIISRILKYQGAESGKLSYKIKLFGFLPAGDAIFNPAVEVNLQGKSVYQISASARTAKWLAFAFSGSAQVESFINKESLNPILFRQKLLLKDKPEVDKEISYNQEQGSMTIAGESRVILPDTQDPLSLMFRLKSIDFDELNNFTFNINTNKKNYAFRGIVQRQNIALEGKAYKIFLVNATVSRIDKNPYHKTSINMVFLRHNGENIPILIKVFSSGAYITIQLTKLG